MVSWGEREAITFPTFSIVRKMYFSKINLIFKGSIEKRKNFLLEPAKHIIHLVVAKLFFYPPTKRKLWILIKHLNERNIPFVCTKNRNNLILTKVSFVKFCLSRIAGAVTVEMKMKPESVNHLYIIFNSIVSQTSSPKSSVLLNYFLYLSWKKAFLFCIAEWGGDVCSYFSQFLSFAIFE